MTRTADAPRRYLKRCATNVSLRALTKSTAVSIHEPFAGGLDGVVLGAFRGAPGPGRLREGQADRLCRCIEESENEPRAMISVAPAVRRPPPSVRNWVMDAKIAEAPAQLLMQERPRLVVQRGSGSSTLLVASCLRKAEATAHHFTQSRTKVGHHLPGGLLIKNDLNDWAEVVTAPFDRGNSTAQACRGIVLT